MLLRLSKKNLTAIYLILLMCGACSFFQSSNTETPKSFTPEEIKSDIPFSTKEPQIFQAEMIITSNGVENKKFIARSGNNRRFDYNLGAKNQVSVIQTDKIYTILADKKIYTETALSGNFPAQSDFSSEWLNAKTDVEFTKIGTENNLTQYRVGFANSEILVFVDENLNFPVRQEFYGLENDQKTLTMTIELRDFKPEASSDLFAAPKNFNKVSTEEFRKVLQSEEQK